MYVSGHQSVYLAQIMMQLDYNLMQWVFLNYAMCIPPYKLSIPPTSKIHASDEKKQTKDRRTSHISMLKYWYIPGAFRVM